jgi:hypothetical protein
MDIFAFFTEVRLHPSSACRAWTEASGCFDAVAWDVARAELPFVRERLESMRIAISEALAVSGIDPLGIMRKLLIHEASASTSRSWIRESGFVHLEAASGIHLYCAWRACSAVLRNTDDSTPFFRSLREVSRRIFPPLLWFLVWGLTGFRPGLIRPLLLVGTRYLLERKGLRWAPWAPIVLAIGFDALLGFLLAYGQDRSFLDWAPGELHYALSWWGGVAAAEWMWKRHAGSASVHLALCLGSWLAILPLELREGRFSPFTPLVSFCTVEALARGGYVLFLISGLGTSLAGEWAREALQWESFLWNQGVGWTARLITTWGGLRTW